MTDPGIVTGTDGLTRCWWGAQPEIYRTYHDEEWGRASTDDRLLFEKICLEGFQSGLSWLTILRKREGFRDAFAGFDVARVAAFGDEEVRRLLTDSEIVRHEGKIRSVINNAARARELVEESGSIAAHVWRFADPLDSSPPHDLPASTPASTALSKDLKRRGWSYVGPTTVYAFMQAMGLVNDHLPGCHVRADCEEARVRVLEGLGE